MNNTKIENARESLQEAIRNVVNGLEQLTHLVNHDDTRKLQQELEVLKAKLSQEVAHADHWKTEAQCKHELAESLLAKVDTLTQANNSRKEELYQLKLANDLNVQALCESQAKIDQQEVLLQQNGQAHWDEGTRLRTELLAKQTKIESLEHELTLAKELNETLQEQLDKENIFVVNAKDELTKHKATISQYEDIMDKQMDDLNTARFRIEELEGSLAEQREHDPK